MPNPNVTAVIALVLSGASLVYALRARTSPPASAEKEEQRVESEATTFDDPNLDELDERLVALERRLLKLELAQLQRGAEGAPGSPPSSPELASLREDVDTLLAADGLAPEAARARLKETLKSLQSEMFAERLKDRQVMRAKAQASAFQRFASEAQLDAGQKAELERLLQHEEERVRELMEQGPMEGPEGWRGVRRNMRSLRGETDAAAKALLREDQLTKYETMRREARRDLRGPERGGAGPRR